MAASSLDISGLSICRWQRSRIRDILRVYTPIASSTCFRSMSRQPKQGMRPININLKISLILNQE